MPRKKKKIRRKPKLDKSDPNFYIIIGRMGGSVPKRKKPGPKRKKLDKSDPNFYALIGKKGGSATKKNHRKSYYARLAQLSHAARQRNKEAALSQEPGTAE